MNYIIIIIIGNQPIKYSSCCTETALFQKEMPADNWQAVP